jgi:adenylate kinase
MLSMNIERTKSDDQSRLSGRLVCVFGIPGVGKTTLIRQFTQEHRNWQALSASSLLARLVHQLPSHLRLADRTSVERNQFRIAQAIEQCRLESPGEKWLLDAHSMIDNDDEWIAVPTAVIGRIRPDSLIFLFDDAAHIERRRSAEPHKRRPRYSVHRIEEEQALALRNCLVYSSELKLDLHQISATDPAEFAATVAQITTRIG